MSSISILFSRTTLLPLPTSGVPGGGGVFPMQAELVPGAQCRWCRWRDVKPEQRKNVTASPANSLQHNLILPSGDNILLCYKHCVDVVCSVFSKHNSRWQAMSRVVCCQIRRAAAPIFTKHTLVTGDGERGGRVACVRPSHDARTHNIRMLRCLTWLIWYMLLIFYHT